MACKGTMKDSSNVAHDVKIVHDHSRQVPNLSEVVLVMW